MAYITETKLNDSVSCKEGNKSVIPIHQDNSRQDLSGKSLNASGYINWMLNQKSGISVPAKIFNSSAVYRQSSIKEKVLCLVVDGTNSMFSVDKDDSDAISAWVGAKAIVSNAVTRSEGRFDRIDVFVAYDVGLRGISLFKMSNGHVEDKNLLAQYKPIGQGGFRIGAILRYLEKQYNDSICKYLVLTDTNHYLEVLTLFKAVSQAP